MSNNSELTTPPEATAHNIENYNFRGSGSFNVENVLLDLMDLSNMAEGHFKRGVGAMIEYLPQYLQSIEESKRKDALLQEVRFIIGWIETMLDPEHITTNQDIILTTLYNKLKKLEVVLKIIP